MIEVFLTRKSKAICAVECSLTESEIAEEIAVRASVVTILHTAVLGLMEVAGVTLDFIDEPASIRFSLPVLTEEKQAERSEVILDTMLLGIADLAETFSDFLALEVREQ